MTMLADERLILLREQFALLLFGQPDVADG